jgi:hypothetical protein
MANPLNPGKVFENLCEINKAYKSTRVLFSKASPLKLDFFTLEFDWISRAFTCVTKEARHVSFSEFQNIEFEADYFRYYHRILVELISDGNHCFLLINTCPIAQLDLRTEMGMVEFFNFPPMTKEEWETWDFLGASTMHFEVISEAGDVHLVHVKKEEGIINALRMCRSLNLRTGLSSFSVHTEKCTLPKQPTLENLLEWIDVRSGISDPSLLGK